MAFVRRKRIRGRDYLYLVENIYRDGSTHQRVLRYLGPVAPVRLRRRQRT